MAEDDSSEPSELEKLTPLAMRVLSVSKDAIYILYPKMKPKPKGTKQTVTGTARGFRPRRRSRLFFRQRCGPTQPEPAGGSDIHHRYGCS
jgi:hypothetical protein